MAENSKIEWTDHTFNPWIGCQKVSPGCDHCYAEALATRYRWTTWGPHGERKRTSPAYWRKPIGWARKAKKDGKRYRVFCASLADVFDNHVDVSWRADLFRIIENTPELDWLLLTKRPENIRKMLPDDWRDGYPNVWLGTTCEDQARADHRIPILFGVPARVRFLSCEPIIGPISFRWAKWDNWTYANGLRRASIDHLDGLRMLDWIIVGGESGPGARIMQPTWAAEIKTQCQEAGTAFFMKQMTGKKPIPSELLLRQFPVPGRRFNGEPIPARWVER